MQPTAASCHPPLQGFSTTAHYSACAFTQFTDGIWRWEIDGQVPLNGETLRGPGGTTHKLENARAVRCRTGATAAVSVSGPDILLVPGRPASVLQRHCSPHLLSPRCVARYPAPSLAAPVSPCHTNQVARWAALPVAASSRACSAASSGRSSGLVKKATRTCSLSVCCASKRARSST